MGKIVLAVVAVILALACGALGFQVLKGKADTQALDKKLADMEVRLKEEIGVSGTQTEQPDKVQAALEEIQSQLSSVDRRIRALEARKPEKKTESGQAQPTADSDSVRPLPDFSKMTPEEREEWAKVIREEMMKLRQKQATAFKEGILKNVRSKADTLAEKLGLTTAQKSEVDTLLGEQVEKGFQLFTRLFQEGDFEGIRTEIQNLVNDTDEKVKEILDPEQAEKLKELDPDGFGRREQQRLESKKE